MQLILAYGTYLDAVIEDGEEYVMPRPFAQPYNIEGGLTEDTGHRIRASIEVLFDQLVELHLEDITDSTPVMRMVNHHAMTSHSLN